MGIINVNIDKIYGRASQAEVDALKGEIEAANRMLYDGSGKGGDFLGWVSPAGPGSAPRSSKPSRRAPARSHRSPM